MKKEDFAEHNHQQPRKEKKSAFEGAIFGVIIGAFIGFALFAIPSYSLSLPHREILLIVGTIGGALQGLWAGPLIKLRFSAKRTQKVH